MELRRQQALELPTTARRSLALAAALLALSAGAASAATPSAPVYDEQGNLVGTPFVPAPAKPSLERSDALEIALANHKIAHWLARYPKASLSEEAEYDEDARTWTIKVWSSLPEAGQIALATVDDTSGAVTEAWTGPQVAWKMARGYDGAFGRKINKPLIWLSLCGVFLLGLADLRRPLSVRNLDLLVLLSFSVSLWFFNRGNVFAAMPLAYPPMAYLLGRMAWIGWRGRGSPARPLWPVWLLLAATVFLAGFRVGLNVRGSNVIDVGLSGVAGAHRIVHGEMPYGHMPTDDGKECGPADADGYVRDRIQTNGRCESADERGDTYGPVSYLAYVPGVLAFGWSGKWDFLPAAHFTSLLWDGLALLGMGVLGYRLGGLRLGATLAFAWAAYPFTQYVSSSNSNDSIMPALLVWGLVLATSATARGAAVGLAAWTKFAALLLLPLWAGYPRALGVPRRRQLAFLGGLLLATAIGFWLLLLEPDPLHAARVFWDRTFGWQLTRPSPFSIWDWDEYPGFPDLHAAQAALKAVLLGTALLLGFFPRRRNVLQLAALSAALLIGFEAVLAPSVLRAPESEPAAETPTDDRRVRELVPAR